MRDFGIFLYKYSFSLVKRIYEIVDKFTDNDNYGLRSPITRTAVSISSNNSVGSSRKSEVEFSRYINIAMCSVFELETHLFLLVGLMFVDLEKVTPVLHI